MRISLLTEKVDGIKFTPQKLSQYQYPHFASERKLRSWIHDDGVRNPTNRTKKSKQEMQLKEANYYSIIIIIIKNN
jgi:hypothetical protein